MNLRGKKALACLSLLLMVLSIVPSGAIANESSSENTTDIAALAEGRLQGKGPMGKPDPEIPEFETEEKEFEYLKEMMTNCTQMRIERTSSMLGDIDEIGDENLTAENLEEQLGDLETLLDNINSTTSLEELKELMSGSMKMGGGREMRGRGPEMETPAFETEEEHLEFMQARTAESVERMIDTLESTDLEEIDSENITNEDIEAVLLKLEDISSRLDSEELTLEDMEEIRESMSGIRDSVREILTALANEKGPDRRRFQEEATA